MGNIGATEIILILLVLILLFGARKLPELARGSGRALRIFKAETKGLVDDEDEAKQQPEERRGIESGPTAYPAAPTNGTERLDEPRRPETDR
jgi:sec-independent protein translocase protein TatA